MCLSGCYRTAQVLGKLALAAGYLIGICAGPTILAAQQCQPPTTSKIEEVANYLARRSKVPNPQSYHFEKMEPVSDSCFWRLTYMAEPASRYVEIFLSPDQTYLAPTVFDLRIDPIASEREGRKRVSTLLDGAKGPTRGPRDAAVTLVEFADFQCPFCKRLHDSLKELGIPSQTTKVIFHNYPLMSHPWALPAAQVAACVSEQNGDAFWDMQDYIFDHQKEIDPSNVKQTLLEYLAKTKSVDLTRLHACIDSDIGKKLVDDDIALAKQVGVGVTPTLFINGLQIRGVLGSEQLKALIQQNASTGTNYQNGAN